MKVFISWSGTLSREIAMILREYLPCILQELDIFMSQHDIESGARWNVRLCQELEHSSFGIICLTTENFGSPWLLFEAGALTKHVEGRACGLLIGDLSPTDVSGPLAQFQHRQFTLADFKALLRDLNDFMKNRLSDKQLEMVFDRWWPKIEDAYNNAITRLGRGTSPKQVRDPKDIMQEILIRVRATERMVSGEMVASISAYPHSREYQYKVWQELSDLQKRLLLAIYKRDREAEALLNSPTPEEKLELERLAQVGLIALASDRYVIANLLMARFLHEWTTTDYSIPG